MTDDELEARLQRDTPAGYEPWEASLRAGGNIAELVYFALDRTEYLRIRVNLVTGTELWRGRCPREPQMDLRWKRNRD